MPSNFIRNQIGFWLPIIKECGGFGKSLAAYLDVLQGQCYAMGLYPTNALARDQETQIQDYIAQFQPDTEPRVNRLSGPDLEIYAENEGLRKSVAIARQRKPER